jgi:hypothetical protein
MHSSAEHATMVPEMSQPAQYRKLLPQARLRRTHAALCGTRMFTACCNNKGSVQPTVLQPARGRQLAAGARPTQSRRPSRPDRPNGLWHSTPYSLSLLGRAVRASTGAEVRAWGHCACLCASSLCVCAHCVFVLTVCLCSLCVCAHCVFVLTVCLCSLCVCAHCVFVPTVCLCPLCVCAHCVFVLTCVWGVFTRAA